MKLLYTILLLITVTIYTQAQTWTKVSGIMDDSQVKGIGVLNDQILVAGQNWITNSQTDYALSKDGGTTWSKLPTYSFAGYLPNKLPQNKLLICSNGFTTSNKLVGNTWQPFAGANNFAEFNNGSIIGSQGSFPDTVYNFSSTGVKGVKLGNYKFKLSHKYCSASNNRLFVFAYGVGLGYIDYSNLGVVNFPVTLDGNAITQANWDMYMIKDMIKTSNGNLFAIGMGVFKSIDNGVNWTTALNLSGDLVISIAKTSTDELYIIGGAKVRKSSDLGVIFTDVSGNLLPSSSAFKSEVFVNTSNEVFIILNKNGETTAGANSGIFKLTNINGISDFDKNRLEFNLYPNPSNSVINVEYLVLNKNTTTIEITNTLGQTILSKNVKENKTQINVDDYLKGIYFLTIKSDNLMSTQKFIVD